MHGSEAGIVITGVVGYAMQWVRAKRSVSDWIYYVGLGLLCVGGYVLVRGEELKHCPSWLDCTRAAAVGIIAFVQAARGSGAMAKDANVAPAANTR